MNLSVSRGSKAGSSYYYQTSFIWKESGNIHLFSWIFFVPIPIALSCYSSDLSLHHNFFPSPKIIWDFNEKLNESNFTSISMTPSPKVSHCFHSLSFENLNSINSLSNSVRIRVSINWDPNNIWDPPSFYLRYGALQSPLLFFPPFFEWNSCKLYANWYAHSNFSFQGERLWNLSMKLNWWGYSQSVLIKKIPWKI